MTKSGHYDPSFRPLPHIDPARAVSYMNASGLKRYS